jgi:hypothetical protein
MTNETYGNSCEKAICEIFNDEEGINSIDEKRVDRKIIEKIKPKLEQFLNENNITDLKYMGSKGNKVDFIDGNKKTYSIKSNIKKSEKVCPQQIGQCTRNTFSTKIYHKLTDEDDPEDTLDNKQIKEFILSNPHKLIKLYYKHLYCCDYLIYIKDSDKLTINIYPTSRLDINSITNKKILFTKNNDNWNESNTLKIQIKDIPENLELNKKNISKYFVTLGEFQIHNHRNCVKFRFNYPNLISFVEYINKKN